MKREEKSLSARSLAYVLGLVGPKTSETSLREDFFTNNHIFAESIENHFSTS